MWGKVKKNANIPKLLGYYIIKIMLHSYKVILKPIRYD